MADGRAGAAQRFVFLSCPPHLDLTSDFLRSDKHHPAISSTRRSIPPQPPRIILREACCLISGSRRADCAAVSAHSSRGHQDARMTPYILASILVHRNHRPNRSERGLFSSWQTGRLLDSASFVFVFPFFPPNVLTLRSVSITLRRTQHPS